MNVNPNLSRRTFLSWYMAGLMTATVVAGLAPILVFIWPPPAKGQKKGDVAVTLDTAPADLQEGDAVRFDAPATGAFVMQDGGGANAPGDIAYSGYLVKHGGKTMAYAVNCSHLGCSINFDKAGAKFACPCHGSEFHLDGSVKQPPAAAPLSRLKYKEAGAKQIAVDGITFGGA